MVDLRLVGQTMDLVRWERGEQGSERVNVQLVKDSHDPLGIGTGKSTRPSAQWA